MHGLRLTAATLALVLAGHVTSKPIPQAEQGLAPFEHSNGPSPRGINPALGPALQKRHGREVPGAKGRLMPRYIVSLPMLAFPRNGATARSEC